MVGSPPEVLTQALKEGSAPWRWDGVGPGSQKDSGLLAWPAGRCDELKLVGGHHASVEAALIIGLAFLHGCHSLLLLAHPAVSGVGKLERPVWLGKEEQP